MAITLDFIRDEVEKQSYEISLHADDERIAEGLTISQLEFALSDCKIIEEYPDDPRGESCLVLGCRNGKTHIQETNEGGVNR